MDSISALSVFVQVAKMRSFVAVGRALGVSASAIGKRIGALEDELGVRLFHRSTRSVTLTVEGKLFLGRCERILLEVDAAQVELQSIHQAPKGRLRMSLPLVTEPFLPVIADFKIAYPEVDLDFEFTDRQVDVIEEGYDAVVRTGDIRDSRLTAKRLGSYKMMLVATPAYLARHGTPRSVPELMRHPLIQFRFSHTGKIHVLPIPEALKVPDFEMASPIICNNMDARICFAMKGLGIAYLPDFALQSYLDRGELVQVFDMVEETGTFHIMWPSGKHVQPKLRVFIDYLSQHLFPQQKTV